MRYLVESFAVGALGRGRSIAQFLGPVTAYGNQTAVCWVEVQPRRGAFRVVLHVVEDVGGERFVDLWEFPAADPDEEFGRELAVAEDALRAMVVAEELTSAVRERWVDLGVVQDKYLDYVRDSRSPGA